jgi:hypothetical protein
MDGWDMIVGKKREKGAAEEREALKEPNPNINVPPPKPPPPSRKKRPQPTNPSLPHGYPQPETTMTRKYRNGLNKRLPGVCRLWKGKKEGNDGSISITGMNVRRGNSLFDSVLKRKVGSSSVGRDVGGGGHDNSMRQHRWQSPSGWDSSLESRRRAAPGCC